MNVPTLVDAVVGAQPLDETVGPRRRPRPPHARADALARPLQRPPSPRLARESRVRRDKRPAAASVQALDDTIAPRSAGASAPMRSDLLLYLLLLGLIVAAWQISQSQLFKRTDDTHYWIGVVGGSMVLGQFLYPMRKHLPFMRGWGSVKNWFWVHLGLGLGGPWLILIHSQFRIGSINAGVALYSLGVAVASGVVGRFIYVRVHRGLNGERTSLTALRERAGLIEDNARSRLSFCPAVERRLLSFERRELRAQPTWASQLRQVSVLPLQQWLTYLACVRDLRKPLRRLAKHYQWGPSDLRKRKRRARRLVDQYLHAVVRVAQYSAYDRVFALWHTLHLPFVYLLVISAVVHVIAVHAY